MKIKPLWIKVDFEKKIARSDVAEVVTATYDKPHLVDNFIEIKLKKAVGLTFMEFFRTVVHEFIHTIFFILKEFDMYQATYQSEEKYCQEMENASLLCWWLLRPKKKKKK